MSLLFGTRFGSYVIGDSIGRGGMGEVYRATDTNLKRDVAIKVLPESFAGDADRLARFQREAEVLASLNHINIAQIFGLERVDDVTALVMELIEGVTLADRLRHGPIEPDEAIEIATQIAAALESAHERGVVHRDLKPANIMLRPDGIVTVLDFGLAKNIESSTTSTGNSTRARVTPALTEVGVILGTAAYMSPEQARGRPLDKRADIWAFGAVFYEMLTGQPPFVGEDETDTVASVLRSDPDWNVLPDLPPILEAFLKQCLEKNPKDRIHDIADVRLALSGAYQVPKRPAELDSEAAPARAWLRIRWIAAALGGLVLGAASISYWISSSSDVASAMSVRQLTFRHGNVGAARFASDGQVIIYGAAWDDEPYRLFTTRLDSYQSRPIDLPPADLLAVSGDSRLALALSRQAADGWLPHGLLADVPLAGGAPRVLDSNVVAVEWGSDGELAAIVHWADREARIEFPAGTVVHEANTIGPPRLSPDGNHVCFQSNYNNLMVAERGRPATTLATPLPRINTCTWSPNGDEVWFTYSPSGSTHENLEAISLDGRTRRVLASLTAFGEVEDVSADGSVLIAAGALRFSVVGSRSSDAFERDLTVFDASRIDYLNAAGTQILITDNSTGARPGGRLFLRPMDGSPPIQIGDATALGLTPDGAWVAVLGDGSQPLSFSDVITLIPAAAGEARTILLPIDVQIGLSGSLGTNTWEDRYPDFSDDGQRLLLPIGRDESGVARAYVHDFSEGWTRPVTPEGITGPVVLSPDGRFVASNEPDGMFVNNVDTGDRYEVPGGRDDGMLARWSADEDVVYLVEPDGAGARLLRRNIKTGERVMLREVRAPDPAGVTKFDLFVARDGETYAYNVDRWLTNLFVIENVR